MINPGNPSEGIVTGDNVRIRAGHADGNPLHSDTEQRKVNRGDIVKLLGVESNDYYKIKPPQGAYFWVSTEYTNPLGSIEQVPLEKEPEPVEAETVEVVEPVVTPQKTAETNLKLKTFYELQEQFEAERKKLLGQQNYDELKKALKEIGDSSETEKAARYARYTLDQIKRSQFGLDVAKTVEQQDKELEKIMKNIETARQTRHVQNPDLGQYAAIGTLETSPYYDRTQTGRIFYRILDSGGKIICYATPKRTAMGVNLSSSLGKKVGIVGTIGPHVETSGTLVQFSRVDALD
jgi:hypothetical protein